MKQWKKIEESVFSLFILFLPSQLGKHFWPNFSYIGGLRIDYLSPTFYFTDLLIILLFISNIFKRKIKIKNITSLLNKQTINQNLSYFLIFLIFSSFITLNIINSSRPLLTLYSWLRTIELAAVSFYIIKARKSLIDKVYKLLPITLLYSSTIAIIQFIKQSSIGGLIYWLGERRFSISTPGIAKTSIDGKLILRPYGTFSHPNALAGFVLVVSILLFYYFRNKNNLSISKYSSLVILIATTIFFTFSQINWILAITIIALVISKKYIKNIIFLTLLLLTLLSSTLFLFPLERDSINQRIYLNQQALRLTKENFYTGVGLGNFIPSLDLNWQKYREFSSLFLYYQPVHNIFLLISTETGFIGLLLFAYLSLKTLKRSFKRTDLGLMVAMLIVLISGMVDHYWLTLNQNRLLLAVIFGLIWK